MACVLNIALDFIFILTFKMGVAGAAWATVVAQVVSCVLCIVYIIKRIPLLRLCKKDWKVDASFVGLHCKIGLPMAFQTSIIAIGAMILQIPLNQLGSTAVGAFTAAQKIDNLAVQVLMSFGITMATYAAQNYGAGNMRRIKQGVNRCILINVIASVILGVFIILTCRPLVGVCLLYTSHDAAGAEHPVAVAGPDDLLRQAGGNNELSARQDGDTGSFGVQHRPGTHDGFEMCIRDRCRGMCPAIWTLRSRA